MSQTQVLPPQLWMLVGGNGAGKTTFFQQFLQPLNLPFVNADLIAKEYFPQDPEGRSHDAAKIAERLRLRLIEDKRSFCFETVFSHPSKIDFIGTAKAAGFEVILVFIHLSHAQLNLARVAQRIEQGGHSVPEDKVQPRIERLTQQVALILELGLADQVHVFDNSSVDNPYQRLFSVIHDELSLHTQTLPEWASVFLDEAGEE